MRQLVLDTGKIYQFLLTCLITFLFSLILGVIYLLETSISNKLLIYSFMFLFLFISISKGIDFYRSKF